MRNNKYFVGALLILIGLAMILGNMGILDMSWISRLTWPVICLIISGIFFMGYSSRRPYGAGLLMPGGILLTVGVTGFFGELLGYDLMWPGFVLAPAVGLFLLYWFGSRSSGLLVPIGILLTVASVCYISELFGIWDITWPGFILSPAVGLFLLYLSDPQKNSGLMVPIFIITAISVMMFAIFAFGDIVRMGKYLFGGVLIIGGIALLLRRPASNDSGGQDDHSRFEP